MTSFRDHFAFSRRMSRPGTAAASTEAPDEAQTAYERRRQQVRRAQRNHRERKANYIKALESEVVNLRKQNQQNIISLETEISSLRSMLSSYGIELPPRQARVINASDEPVDAGPSSYTVSKPPGVGQSLQVSLPELSPQASQENTAIPGFTTLGASGPQSTGALTPATSQSSPSPYLTPMGDLVSPVLAELVATGSLDKVVGIDFVLALEHPCMAHPDMTKDTFGTHSHMASHTLLSYAPQEMPADASANWEVPGADIRSLLNMSNSFQLEGEITPVQAWYRLKEHPRFQGLKQAQVEALKRILFGTVKCYGFGSVMEESDWNIAVEEVVARS